MRKNAARYSPSALKKSGMTDDDSADNFGIGTDKIECDATRDSAALPADDPLAGAPAPADATLMEENREHYGPNDR